MTSKGATPPSYPVNVLNISTTNESKITNISLYSGRAEVTRQYRFAVQSGQNQIKIDELPNVIDQNSLRVEGRGAATIQGVALARTPEKSTPPVVTSTEKLDGLLKQKLVAEKALVRCNRSLSAIKEYLSTITVQRVEPGQLGAILRSSETEAEQLDAQVIELGEEIESLNSKIDGERLLLTAGNHPAPTNSDLNMTANIGLFASSDGDAEITLIYAVTRASWHAGYDIRVNMQATEKPVNLVYKAIISQTTGEDWKDAPLTLETVTPTYGAHIPVLTPWKLSIYRPAPPPPVRTAYRPALPRAESGMMSQMMLPPPPGSAAPPPLPEMAVAQASVASQTTLNTTFQVPGLINIPSDGESHNVTIAELALEAEMSWVCVPKLDKRVHLKATIKNATDYALLPGSSSVYVDGSFISKSSVPSVTPEESFECSLGIDSAIRVTYAPLSKNSSQSGLLSKSNKRVYVQRLSIFNAKNRPINNLKIIERFPVSEDAQITTKFISPSLTLPTSSTGTTTSSSLTGSISLRSGKSPSETSIKPLMPPVKVSEGVVAQWDGGDDVTTDILSLGRNGLFNWLCKVPPQGTINLTAQWEVSYPVDITVSGL